MSETYAPPRIAGETPATAPAETPVVANRFLNLWRESIARSTDADPVLVMFAGVGVLSAVCRDFFFYAPRETHPNLFIFILGPSSTPRKTTVLDMACDYLVKVDPFLVLPNEFTAEALWKSLAEQSRGIVFSRELNAWLDQMLGKDYNSGLASTLGNLYDHTSRMTRRTKKDGLLTIENPVITILGGGVDEYLVNHLKKMDMVSGFWPRVTLVQLAHPAIKPFRPPGEFRIDPDVVGALKAIASQKAGEIRYRRIARLREAYSDQLQREAAGLDNPNLATGYARLEWALVKIAVLLELADRPDSREVGEEAFNDAVALVDYVKRGLPGFYGEHFWPDEEPRIAAWALDFIRKHDEGGSAWVPYRAILQAAHSSTVKLKAALGRLVETEDIESVPVPAPVTGGKAGTAYRRKQC